MGRGLGTSLELMIWLSLQDDSWSGQDHWRPTPRDFERIEPPSGDVLYSVTRRRGAPLEHPGEKIKKEGRKKGCRAEQETERAGKRRASFLLVTSTLTSRAL